MIENTNQTNYEDLFVDTADNIAEKVTDSNDFYDDNDFMDTNASDYIKNESLDVTEGESIPVNNFSFDPFEDNLVENEENEQPIEKLEFNNDLNIPFENEELVFNEVKDEPINFEEVDEEPVEFEEIKLEEPEFEELNEVEQTDNLEEAVELPETKEDVEKSFDPFNISNLTNDDMDKMIEEDNKKEELDDSYVLSNFDVLFDSLYNDVNGANNFISNLIEQKKNVNTNEATLKEEEEKLLKEKEEFAKYMQVQKESIEAEKEQCKEYVKTQKNRIQSEEEKFNNDMEAAKAERKLAEESLKIEEQKLLDEKEQFKKYKEIEEEKIKSEKEKLEVERQQFEKEKEIELEKIKNDKKELQTQKDQFAKTKELEEKKLELESKNLSQSCARFKELVSQFNSGFQQLPEDK